MKKLTVISFLIIFALGQCGYYCFHAFQLYKAKKEARAKILRSVPEELLVKINIQENKNAIHWEDDGKEFRLDGKMYDVVRIKNENGKQYVICVNDDKEDAVLEALVKTVSSNIEKNNGTGKSHTSAKIVIQDYIFETHGTDILSCNLCVDTKIKYFNYKSPVCSGFIRILSPPPNLNI